MRDGTNCTPTEQYNVFTIVDDEEWGELFTVEVTDRGIHLDHNFMEGGLFISHEGFEDLNEFRQEFLQEIAMKNIERRQEERDYEEIDPEDYTK